MSDETTTETDFRLFFAYRELYKKSETEAGDWLNQGGDDFIELLDDVVDKMKSVVFPIAGNAIENVESDYRVTDTLTESRVQHLKEGFLAKAHEDTIRAVVEDDLSREEVEGLLFHIDEGRGTASINDYYDYEAILTPHIVAEDV